MSPLEEYSSERESLIERQTRRRELLTNEIKKMVRQVAERDQRG